MASKLICFVAVLCALQYVQVAAVQKRSVIDDIKTQVEQVAQDALKKAADAVSEASSLWDQLKSKASEVISSVSATLNAKAEEAKDKIQEIVSAAQQIGRNIGPCLSEGLQEVDSVLKVAVGDLQTCANSAGALLEPLYADMLNLGNLSAQLVRDIPSDFSACKATSLLQVLDQVGCYIDTGNTALSRGLLLVSSLAYDASQYKTEFQEASEKVLKCGIDEVEEAVKKYGDISQTVQTCVLTGPSTE